MFARQLLSRWRSIRQGEGLARRARGLVGHLEAGAVDGMPPEWPEPLAELGPQALLEETRATSRPDPLLA